MRRFAAALAAVGLVALSVAGCGDDGADPATPTDGATTGQDAPPGPPDDLITDGDFDLPDPPEGDPDLGDTEG